MEDREGRQVLCELTAAGSVCVCVCMCVRARARARARVCCRQVRCELLTAAVKLFVRRPPEMIAMLGRLLAAAVCVVCVCGRARARGCLCVRACFFL